jgi:hypothetical protein
MPHESRKDLAKSNPCHVTMRVVPGLPSLRGRDPGAQALGRGMKSLASLFAFAVNGGLERTGRVLADRYHHKVLRSPRQVRNAIAYVLLNARRCAAKRIARRKAMGLKNVAPLGRARGADPYSSGRWFEGWRSAASPARPAADPPVAAPRTWFLRKGWRLHGLIDPSEIPAELAT